MNLKVEYGIIAILLLAFLYYFFTHQSLLSDLSLVPHEGNEQLKGVKEKHTSALFCGRPCPPSCPPHQVCTNSGPFWCGHTCETVEDP